MFKKKLTTINFEGNEIRFLVTKGETVRSWHSRKFPPELMSQGLVQEPEAVGDDMRAILKELKASRRNVITSITGQRSVHRIMHIPNIHDNLLEETIRRKAKQEFAIPIDETDISWRIIGRGNDQIILYVLAIPNLIIDQLVATLKAAKIKPNLMDIKPLALQRLVNSETAIIVNLEEFSLGVIIIANHIPILVRTVPLETGDLSDEAKTDLLAQELTRTVKFYNESNKNNRLPDDSVVYLSGGLFEISQVDTRLEGTVDLQERLQLRTPYPVQLPRAPFSIPPKLSLTRYAVNLGLTLKSR